MLKGGRDAGPVDGDPSDEVVQPSFGLDGALPTLLRELAESSAVMAGAMSLDTMLLVIDERPPASSSGEASSDGLRATTGTWAKCSVGIRICEWHLEHTVRWHSRHLWPRRRKMPNVVFMHRKHTCTRHRK